MLRDTRWSMGPSYCFYQPQNSVNVTLLSPFNAMSRTGACVFVKDYVNNGFWIKNCNRYDHCVNDWFYI